jgi:hypothetical protein
MKQVFIYLILSVFLVLTSCQKQESSVPRKDDLKKGNQMLDEGKYDQAIRFFTKKLDEDDNRQFRLALASAYAARAGLTRKDFVAIADVAMMKTSAPEEWGDIFKLLFFLQGIKDRWDAIPTVETAAKADLKRALEVLAPSDEPSVRLYSAALRTIYIKATMGDGLDPWLRLNHKNLCKQDIKPLLKWSNGVIYQMQELGYDLQGAYPSKKEHFGKMQEDLAKASDQINSWNQERSLLCP